MKFLENKDYNALLKIASSVSIIAAIFMVIVKGYVWISSGSASVLSAFVDSLTDVIASSITFLAVKYSAQPADSEHKFGYGKLEAIAGLTQSLFIILSALFVLGEIAKRWYTGEYTTAMSWENTVIMASTLLITAFIVVVQKIVIKKTNSLAIQADSMHYTSDFILNGSVLIGMIITVYLQKYWIDLAVGFCIGLYILKNGFHIGKIAVLELTDVQISKEERDHIKQIILSNKNILGMHNLRTRRSGQKVFIQCDIEVEGNLSLNAAHDIAIEVETMLDAEIEHADIMIHIDPYGDPHEDRNHATHSHAKAKSV